ncbi:MAG: LAGLIDADG family homing endonuclease [Chloroflexota bacterium]|nr:LAGLIDADG family homing endonuclease [Chloroflexota bacterium]
MIQSPARPKNALHDLGYKIFLDRYALKDMKRKTLQIGDLVIVVVNPQTGQREIGKVTALALPKVTIELLDGEVTERDIEHVDKPLETDPAQMMERVAKGIATVEKNPKLRKQWAERFRWLLEDFKFVPAGRILAAAGTNQDLTFYNCYVISSPHDSRAGIIKTLSEMTEIMSRGGGVGINISSLRPRHSYVKGVNGRSSGSVSWGALYSFVTGLIEQGGCFGPDERILTSVGLIPAAELADRIEEGETFYAHTHKGLRQITARFRNGVKPLYEVTTKSGYKTRITAEHKVAVLRAGKVTTVPLNELGVGDEILLLLGQGVDAPYVRMKPVNYERSIMSTTLNEDVRLPDVLTEDTAYLLGYMHGDGYVHMGKKVNWSAPKAIKMATADAYPQIRERIINAVRNEFGLGVTIENGDGALKNISVYSRLMIEWMITNGLLKAKADKIRVPEAIFRSPSSVMAAFIAGYFDADGCFRGRKGGYGIDSISLPMLHDVQQLLAINGIVSHIHTTDRSAQGWQTIHRLTITGGTFKQRFAAFVDTAKVSDNNGTRDMYQTYPSDVLAGIGVRSKYRQRIYDGVSARVSVGQMTKINARLAADGQAIVSEQVDDLLRTLPDTIASIASVGDSEVYDFEVDDVHLISGAGIYTSNSRRGALMLILNDWHPDVFDFINSKRQAGQITNANISVNISDKLMAAIKADGDWELMFPDTSDPKYDSEWNGDLDGWRAKSGKVIHYRTVKAREIWNAIIESAWASAEPGLWFGERSNKESNSAYFNPLICTNPCVTGDTRISTDRGLIQARELFDSEQNVNVVVDGRFGHEDTITPASRVIRTGTKQVYRVQTREGYYVRATADHRIMTARGWVEVQDLHPGTRLHIVNRKGGFGTQGSLELGRVLGWTVGDGTVKKDQVVLSFFGEEKRELAPMFAEYVNEMVEPLSVRTRSYPVGVTQVIERDEARVSSTRLHAIIAEHGLTATKHRVPESVFQGSEDMQRGFLQALFTADGSFQDGGTKGASVRLAANSITLLEQVQSLLLNFGIASHIYRNRRAAGYRQMPDANRELKAYWCEAQHELAISKRNMNVFAAEIGFLMAYKQDKLEAYLERGVRGTYNERFTATVESIVEDGVEEVFDLTEPITHSFVGNNIVLHNCGEQSLGAYSVCNLGAINLAKFYDEDKHDVNWELLDTAVRYATRFLDNVIDATPYFFEENERVQKGERRVGLNNMGLAELLIKLELRYGSPESIPLIDKLYAFIARASYETSIELAQEKGAFPQFDGEKFVQSGFMQKMPTDIRERVRKEGIRNVTLLTQAPTGCVAPDTLISTNTGLQSIVSMGNPDGEQWQIMNRQVYTDVGLRGTSHFFVNGRQPVKSITTKRGFSITATHNHRIRVIDQDGGYEWRRMDELQSGDQVVLKKNTLGEGERITLTPVAQGNRAFSKLPDELSVDFAEMLGLYMGDGYTKRRGGIHIVVCQQDPDLRDYVSKLLQRIWGEQRTVTFEVRRGAWVANLTGYYIRRFFDANGFTKPNGNRGEGAAGAFIPEKILRAGRAHVAAFLRGMFEADGSAHDQHVTLASSSQTLVKQVQIALLGLGIVANVRRMPEQTGRFGTRPMYEVRILNRKEIAKFRDMVGFISERKRSRIAELGNSDGRGDTIPVMALCEDFYQSSQGLKNNVRQSIVTRLKNGALNQHFVRELVAEHPILQTSRLGQLVSMDVFLDEVATIEDGECNTYDLSVPDNHTYIANGFVSHNTTGTMVNTSTGIEPFFSWKYYRKSRLGLHEENVPIAQEWLDAHPGETELPDYFATAMDLAPEDHAQVQAAIQRWVDSSISKTSNLPNNYTVEQVGKFYELLYDLGCKGGTVYRDGSRSEQVLMLKGDERAESEMKDNDKAKSTPAAQEQVATPHRVYPRPKKLTGVTVNTPTPYGTSYITMNSDENGYPFEVFITAPGKAGSDLQADAEGLGRMISLQLRTTAPQNRMTMLRLIIDQLQGIGGSRTVGFGPSRVLSLPDALAAALLEQYFSEEKVQQLDLFNAPVPPASAPVETSSAPPTPVASNGNGHHNPNGAISGATLCPSCGTISLVRADGCRKCLSCGYSEC